MQFQRSNFSKTIVGKALGGTGKVGQVATKVIETIGSVFKRSPQKKQAIRLAKRQGLRGQERRNFIKQYLEKTGVSTPTTSQKAEAIANEISQAFMSPQNENVAVTQTAFASASPQKAGNIWLWVIGGVAIAVGTGLIKLK